MRLTIIGAGAIGGTIGAHLIRAGHDVLLCDADPEHVAAINSAGLTIEGPVESFTVPATAVTPDCLPGGLDRVAIAVKSHHTREAAKLLRGRLGPDGYVVSFQNGLNADAIAAQAGRDRVLASFVNIPADVIAPGRIMQGHVGMVRIGEPYAQVITPRVAELAQAVPYAVATGNIMGFLWAKQAYGAMLFAGAVSPLPIADTFEDPRWRPLMTAVAREVLSQATARPEPIDGFDPGDLEGSFASLVAFNRGSAKSHSGIYRDLVVRKRKTEVDGQLAGLRGPLTGYIAELVRAIESGQRRCEVANLELLATCERTERLGRPLHAVVRVIPAPARQPGGPLHGLAVAVKDLIDVAGVTRGNGNPADMAAPPARSDAPVVAALRAAGADVYATTALLEYAAGNQHPDLPMTLNPYDLTRMSGGSSGGSAALVGAGACDVALGTDTGGSIRIPAHWCGVVGFKPTFGALSARGVTPLAPSLDHVGLLARDVATTTRVFAALTGAGPVSAPAVVRIGILADQLDAAEVDPEVAAAIREAAAGLSAGFDVTELPWAAFWDVGQAYDDILLAEAWRVHREAVERDPSHFGPGTLKLLLSGSKVSRDNYLAALRRRDELAPLASAAYDQAEILLSPAAGMVAPAAEARIRPGGGLFTRSYNITGAPAIVLPCGWSSDGLPIGLQLSARRGADLLLLAAAARIEEALSLPRRQPAVT